MLILNISYFQGAGRPQAAVLEQAAAEDVDKAPAEGEDQAAAGYEAAAEDAETPEAGDSTPQIQDKKWKRFISSAGVSVTGSWKFEDVMNNRIDASLNFPLEFSLRTMLLDKRPDFFCPDESRSAARTNFGFALYQRPTNSRILYGGIRTWGLSARTAKVWIHSAPWFESHKPSGADLKTSVSSGEENLAYFNIGSPLFKPFGEKRFGISADFSVLTSDFGFYNSIFSVGSNLKFGKNTGMRIEYLYRKTKLPGKAQKTWFSDDPFKIERELEFYAANMVFSSKYVSLALDFAQSSIFSFGNDIYANAALCVNIKSYSFSFAVDGAGSRYSGCDGVVTGAGLRTAWKFEWDGKRNAEFLASTTLLSDAYNRPFYGSSSKLRYYFPIIKSYLITPSRLFFDFDCDARDRLNIQNDYSLLFGLNAAALRPAVRLNLSEIRRAGEGDSVVIYPFHDGNCVFEHLKAAFELSAPVYFLTFKGSAVCKIKPEAKNKWDFAITSSMSGKYGRLSLKISYSQEKDAAEYYLSYTFKGKIPEGK